MRVILEEEISHPSVMTDEIKNEHLLYVVSKSSYIAVNFSILKSY